MLILGRNTDEVGSNLERLTKRLLENLGHQHITTNFVGSGAEELDVVSDFPVPLLGGSKPQRVISECKAYRDPVDMGAWLKFLGKIFVEEAKLGAEVAGLFVALSGVNGNVAGNFDELRTKKSNVRLVTGAELHAELAKVYGFPEPEQILAKFKKLTSRPHLSIDLAYYNEKSYWVITLQDQAYTVLDANGAVFSGEKIALIRPLVEKRLPVKTYVDLQEEAKRNERQLQLAKLVLEILFGTGGNCSRANVVPADLGFSADEIDAAIGELLTVGLVTQEGENLVLACAGEAERSANFARCMLFLFKGQVLVETISRAFLSEFFKAQITNDFLDYASEVQKGLVLPTEDRDWIIKVLSCSPSALAYALIPDPLITTHRETQPGIGDTLAESNDYSTYKRKLWDGLANDFAQPGLQSFYLEGLQIVEIETSKQIRLKSSTEVIAEQEVNERYGLARGTPELGGGIVRVLIFNEAPQPWEPGGIGRRSIPASVAAPTETPLPAAIGKEKVSQTVGSS